MPTANPEKLLTLTELFSYHMNPLKGKTRETKWFSAMGIWYFFMQSFNIQMDNEIPNIILKFSKMYLYTLLKNLGPHARKIM